jgi:hypothetical protein
MISLREAIVDARLAGLHGHDRRERLDLLVEEGFFDEADVKQLDAAFTEGVAARLSGYPCHCISCHSFTPQMVENEYRRVAYSNRRWHELLAAGKPHDEI